MPKRFQGGLGGTEYIISKINQPGALAMAHDASVTGVSIVNEGGQRYSSPWIDNRVKSEGQSRRQVTAVMACASSS